MPLPEDIENIEDFYRQSLGDIEVSPPEGLWKKVEDGLNKRPTDFNLKGWFFGSISIVSIIAITYWLQKNDATTNTIIPNTTKSSETKSNPISNSTVKIEKSEIEKEPQTNIKKEKHVLDINKSEKTVQIEQPTIENKIVELAETPSAEQIKETSPSVVVEKDPTVENKEEIKVEEKPLSYYEKIKNKAKDSLRPIFVPKK